MAASEQRRRLVGNAGDAVKLLEDAGDNQRQTEGQEQSVEMVEMVEPPYQQALQHDADRADDDWSEQQGPPIADDEIGQKHPGGERAQHVLRAMSEVNDVEQAENDRNSKDAERIKRDLSQAAHSLANHPPGGKNRKGVRGVKSL